MQYNRLGQSGLVVSRLCFGTMTFTHTPGEGRMPAVAKVRQKEADDIVAACLDNGVNFFNSADVYANGEGEEMLGAALGKRRQEAVIGTKVGGLLAILQHTAHDPLKAVVAFSSVAGRFGNVGQVDYAMANEAMTRILTGVKAKRPQLVVKSLHWGPWEGGMVTPELKAAFASRGVTVIARDDGARAFVAELSTAASDDVEVVLGASLASARPGLDGPGGVKKSSSRIDASSMPFLADHAVKGEVVLPVVVAMDLMLSAAVDAGLGAVHAISDVEVLRGQRLPRYLTEGHVGEATVSVEPNGRLRLELRIDGVLGYRALATVGSAVAEAVVTVRAERGGGLEAAAGRRGVRDCAEGDRPGRRAARPVPRQPVARRVADVRREGEHEGPRPGVERRGRRDGQRPLIVRQQQGDGLVAGGAGQRDGGRREVGRQHRLGELYRQRADRAGPCAGGRR